MRIGLPRRRTNTGARYSGSFAGCSSLKEVVFPNAFTTIGRNAFRNCNKLCLMALPVALVAIGKNAFLQCSSLREITMPATLVTLGDGAFSGCSSLVDIRLYGVLFLDPTVLLECGCWLLRTFVVGFKSTIASPKGTPLASAHLQFPLSTVRTLTTMPKH
jgi:hypothetical protein